MDKYICECDVIHCEVVEDVSKKLMPDNDYTSLAMLFKLFGDPTRLRILHALEQSEMCVCDLAALLGLTKSAVSHQLKSLKTSNLVKNRRDGQVIYYSLADSHVKTIIDIGLEHIREPLKFAHL